MPGNNRGEGAIMGKHQWPWLIVTACALTMTLLAACHRAQQATPSTGPGAAGSQAGPSANQPAPRFNTQMLDGADTEAIRGYLRSVHEVKPSKFEV
ncbi:MAG: hypothetical protein JO005_04695, partial [Gammaproteobacteria bacterium]|nr:hypothetical protein [Gammaproteobacteria bacterium]